MSGYGIKKAIAQSTNHFWSESYGNLYPSLQKLVRNKWIKPLEQKAQSSKRREIKYALTEVGKKQLAAWLNQPHQSAVRRDELLLKIFFGKEADTQALMAQLQTEAYQLEKELQTLKAIQKAMPPLNAKKPDLIYPMLTLNSGFKELTARLEWCHESIASLKKIRDKK